MSGKLTAAVIAVAAIGIAGCAGETKTVTVTSTITTTVYASHQPTPLTPPPPINATTTVAPTPPPTTTEPTGAADNAYVAELDRIDVAPKDPDYAIQNAKFQCKEMAAGGMTITDSVGAIMFLMSSNATIGQIWGMLRAGIETYCPEQASKFYESVASQKITLP